MSDQSARRPLSPSGYRTCSIARPRSRQDSDEPASMRPPEHLVLFDGDRYVATAQHDRLLLFRYEGLPGDEGDATPIIEFQTAAPVRHLEAWSRSNLRVVIVALADDTLWAIELPDPSAGDAQTDKPSSRLLADDLGGRISHLFCTRRTVLLVVEEGRHSNPVLVNVDPQTGRVLRRAPIPLDRLMSVTPFDPDRSDLLLAVDSRHGAHLIGFPTDSDAATVEAIPFDPSARVTAARALDDQWVVIARKGGEVMQVRSSPAAAGRAETAAEICRRLRVLLTECGCGCDVRPHHEPCDCDEPADPTQGGGPDRPTDDHHGHGGRPSRNGVVDDEPCREKHRANLGWTVAELRKVGHRLTVISARGDRMAVLDHNLNVIFERYLGPRGAVVVSGATSTDRLLTLERGTSLMGVWSLDDYAHSIRGQHLDPPFRPGPADTNRFKTVTFHGQRSQSSTPNPHLKVAVFTVTEPGQTFGDPDQTRMQGLLETNVYDIVRDYYDENSFDTLDTQFSVFGVHLGTPRRPLVLPRPIASYFYDNFTPGGIEAVMPGLWATPLVLDGTESMTLRTNPAVGTSKDYPIPFAALWTSRIHNTYPVGVAFTGTETLPISVQDQMGTTHSLTLDFGPLNLNHAQGDNEDAFLLALGQHATNAVRAAETAAGAPTVLQNVVFRRIRPNDDDTKFGRLQAQFRVATAAGATQKGRVTITPPASPAAGLVALGFTDTSGKDGTLGSTAEITSYFAECLHAALFDAGEGAGLNDPQLATVVVATEDAAAQTVRVRIQLSEEKGGSGAEITRLTSSGLVQSGWATAAPVPGSMSNANNSNTMREHQDLANDVFTAAMDHLRASGPWDAAAARNQFADFDAMMIGFVGACPTTVPAADRWNCVNAADFSRLRMFVRYHQATDLHNPTPNDSVTMETNLLIGQRFNQFDPGVMSHEIGHGLGLPDLYRATGFRNDVSYLTRWCQMADGNYRFNHFCAWSKWSVGWIVESPFPWLNRVIDVPMPAPSGTTTTEAWLVPVEHWDNTIRADVEAAVGTGIPIGQMMKLHLGSDGGIVDLIELRSTGTAFSQQLPPTPAVIVTNVLQPGTDRRWAVNGLYRRNAHLLNDGNELIAVGDAWDFAAGNEFPVKGCVAEIVDLRTIRGGTIPICRLKVERKAAEFIDLHFQDNVPSWRSPDVWVDWPVDNPDPTVPRTYPVGTPTDQGEVVRFPSSGVEPHFLVARPHNAGNVHAEDVKIRWFSCDPPGAGDDGRWVERDTQTLPQVGSNSWEIAPFTWNVDPATNAHQCLRAEIIDWTIPSTVDPATGDTMALSSDDVLLQNNLAQKNVSDFEATT